MQQSGELIGRHFVPVSLVSISNLHDRDVLVVVDIVFNAIAVLFQQSVNASDTIEVPEVSEMAGIGFLRVATEHRGETLERRSRNRGAQILQPMLSSVDEPFTVIMLWRWVVG